jgi:hypothetical protein
LLFATGERDDKRNALRCVAVILILNTRSSRVSRRRISKSDMASAKVASKKTKLSTQTKTKA